jgi:hypothetical protein
LAPQRWIALQQEDRKKASFTAQAAAAVALDPLPQAMVMMQQAQISMTPFLFLTVLIDSLTICKFCELVDAWVMMMMRMMRQFLRRN